MQDKIIVCGCGKEFMFRAKDQAFFRKMVKEGKFKGPYTEPKRCMDCRDKKRRDKETNEIREVSPFKPLLDQMKRGNGRKPKDVDQAIEEAVKPSRQIDEDEYRHERPEPLDFSGTIPGEER